MSLTRRGLLKLLGGTVAAAVVAPQIVLPTQAPLFVPSHHLEMGVPRRIVPATELPPPATTLTWANRFLGADELAVSVPMLLLQDNFAQQWGGRLKAGFEVLVDQATAERWIEFGVAVPGARASRDLQERSAQRRLGKHDARVREAYHGKPQKPSEPYWMV
jgi:hypothetical protein